MSSVFISYARADRAPAQKMAQSLEGLGYRVWWDAELLASDDFTEAIETQLRNAAAVIVIWTPASASSRFVRDEARLALHLNKLVATRSGLELVDIPLGFGGQHTEDAAHLEQITRALDHLRVAKGSSAVGSDGAPFAKDPAAARGSQPIMMSNWAAFFRGLTLRVPKFQYSTNGLFTAVGAIIAYQILALVFFIGAGLVWNYLDLDDTGKRVWFAVLPIFTLGLALLAAKQMTGWFNQRNFTAGILFAIPTAYFFLVTATMIELVARGAEGGSQQVLLVVSIVIIGLVGLRCAYLYGRNS